MYGGAGGGSILGDLWALNELAQPQPTAVGETESALPSAFVLHQNYPNPFNPMTAIAYELPATAAATLAIYDILGQKVRTLVRQVQVAGSHTAVWDGMDDWGKSVGAGVYVYRLRVEETTLSRKRLLLN